jgi:hypothetical protein
MHEGADLPTGLARRVAERLGELTRGDLTERDPPAIDPLEDTGRGRREPRGVAEDLDESTP